MTDVLSNYRVVLAYDGTRFSGWQRQAAARTVQDELESTIAVMTGNRPVVHGAGRTDAGVHALAMVANFHTAAVIPCIGFLKGLNSLLADDIRILSVEKTDTDFHARRAAKSKTYCYRLGRRPIPLPTERLYTLNVPGPLDLAAMGAGLHELLGRHDFSSFEAAGSRERNRAGGKGPIRTLMRAELTPAGRDQLALIFTGDGFLRHMVRNMTGTLLEIGRGKFPPDAIRRILAARDRSAAGPTAPARGLFLQEVHYD